MRHSLIIALLLTTQLGAAQPASLAGSYSLISGADDCASSLKVEITDDAVTVYSDGQDWNFADGSTAPGLKDVAVYPLAPVTQGTREKGAILCGDESARLFENETIEGEEVFEESIRIKRTADGIAYKKQLTTLGSESAPVVCQYKRN
jgi:hypothetical protein